MDTITLGPLECLTAAPEDYDYGWMKTIQHNVATDDRGKVYRLARNEDETSKANARLKAWDTILFMRSLLNSVWKFSF